MMFRYDHDIGGWGRPAMPVGMLLFWALIITAAVSLFRTLSPRTRTPAADTPELILRERLARGEIDEEEYRRTLHAESPPKT